MEWLQNWYEVAPDEVFKLFTINSSFKKANVMIPSSDTTGIAEPSVFPALEFYGLEVSTP